MYITKFKILQLLRVCNMPNKFGDYIIQQLFEKFKNYANSPYFLIIKTNQKHKLTEG